MLTGLNHQLSVICPVAGSVSNHVEDRITQRIYAGQVVDRCREAIECCDAISQQILWSVYVKWGRN